MLRRRQLYQAIRGVEPIEVLPPLTSPEITKLAARGTCMKCGKYIGRGKHFHEKACQGQ